MHGQIGDQAIERSFATEQAYRTPQCEGGLEKPVRDFLGNDIVDADDESQRSRARAVLECLDEILAQAEDLIRVVVDQLAYFRRHECSYVLGEQLLAETFLERA